MKYQHRVLGMLSLLSVITYLDRVCIAVAGPRMQDALHISPEAWGWVTSVFFLSYSAFEIPTGALGDRIGPRRVLTRVVAWWSAFTTLTGTVSNYYVLLLVRFCFGAGEAGAYPNASAVIARWIPAAKRTRAWGIVWMTSQVGAALSPLLVVPIQIRYGWRAPFCVFGLLGVAWSLAWYAWFRDSPHEKSGVTEAERREIGSAPGLARHGMPWAAALRRPALWRIAAIGACYVYALGFFQAWLQTYLVKGRGFTELALVLSSLTYVVGAVSNGLGGMAGDWMVRRHGLRNGRRWLGSRDSARRAIPDRGHFRVRRAWRSCSCPLRTAESVSATDPLCPVPRRRTQERRRGLRLHEHRGKRRVGSFRGGLWLPGWLFRELQHAVHSHGGVARFGGVAVVASGPHERTVSRNASRRWPDRVRIERTTRDRFRLVGQRR
jgi:MFS family permease